MIVSKKNHYRILEALEAKCREEFLQQDAIIATLQDQLTEYERRWRSSDGKLVLHDLQEALSLISEYQRVIDLMAAPDPFVAQANSLLAKWGIERYSKARGVAGLDEYVKNEEDKWGAESHGMTKVKIVAERTETGDVVRIEPVEENLNG